MHPNRLVKGVLAALPLVLALATAAHATNGMYLAGYGSEAAGRAGTNIAVADRSMGLQSNPAGIAQLQGQHWGADFQLLAPSLTFQNSAAAENLKANDALFTMPSLSYVRGSKASPWTWGVGLLSQGGMGATFNGYNTPFGTKDGTYSMVRFLTLTPTVAYAVNEDVALGLSVNGGYSDVQFRFYPNTSYYNNNGTPNDPTDDMGFFGADLNTAARAFNASARLGAMWTVTPQVQLGAVYQTKTQGEYTHGTLTLNETAIGLGLVNYAADVKGFTWPEQYGAGVQLRPTDKLMVAVDAKRFLWSKAISKIEVKGSSPDKQSPMTAPILPFVFEWKDAWVMSAGAEYRVNPALTLRGGYSNGENPVPANTLNPLFPAITESHATAGAGWTWGSHTMNVAVERAFETSLTNANTDPNVNPFGPGSQVSHSQWTFSVGYSRALAR